MGARSYLDLAGVFLSPDPRLAGVAALGGGSEADRKSFTDFLSNPQMGNLYAYGLRQPLKYFDPSGLEVVFSNNLAANPTFKHAWRAFASTEKGKEVLEDIEASGGRIYLRSGSPTTKLLGYPTSKRDFNATARMGTVTLNAAGHAASPAQTGITSGEAINNLARDIYREMKAVQHEMMIHGYKEQIGKVVAEMQEIGDSNKPRLDSLASKVGILSMLRDEHAELIRKSYEDPDVIEFDDQLTGDVKP